MKRWRRTASTAVGSTLSPPPPPPPTGVLVTAVNAIDASTAEIFFSANVVDLPTIGIHVNGDNPDNGFGAGSTAHSIYWQGEDGQVETGEPWEAIAAEYDGTFATGSITHDQSGTVA